MASLFKYLSWLWTHSKGVHWRIALNVVLGILNVCLNMAFILACKALVDIATNNRGGSLVNAAFMAGGFLLARLMVSALNLRLENLSSSRTNFNIRRQLYSQLLTSKWLGKERHHSGDVLNRLEQDVNNVVSVVCTDLPQIITTLFQLLAALALMCMMDWRLAVVLLALTPLLLLLAKLFARPMRRMTKDIRESESRVQSHIQESIQHRVVIQSMESEPMMADRLDSLQDTEYDQVVRRTNFQIMARTMVGFAFSGGYLTAFLWGVFGIASGSITFGIMTAFLQLVGQIQRPVVNMSRQIPSFIYATSSIDRLMELENAPSAPSGEPMPMEAPLGIRVEGLSFRYPDGTRDIFRDLSFDFPPLSRTAIVGETGAGKSTLIRLMLSLLEPVKGSVTLYNAHSSTPASPATRCNIVYVPQGNSLFSGSIRENLLLGDPEASEQRMWEVLDIAVASAFVRDLPDGLDTLCGEGGAGLSEGQAQRIAIARGLLRPGSILLLDEFSSSLDPETEEQLMLRLTEKSASKTLIFITHREKISSYCDRECRIERLPR